MGSRATVLVCRDGFRWFGCAGRGDRSGVDPDRAGVLRPAADRGVPGPACARPSTQAGLWDELGTDWLLLDGELLPWSLKAGPLLREQYAATGASARAMLPAAPSASLEAAASRGLDVADLLDRTRRRAADADAFVDGLPPLRLADRRPRRRAAGAVPGARRGGADVPRPRPRLAPVRDRPPGRRRPDAAAPDAAARGRRRRARRRGSTGGRSSPRPAARGWWSSRSPTWCTAGAGWCSRG